MNKNILLISPNFNYSCGVSKHIYLLLKYAKKYNSFHYHFITNGGDSLDRLDKLGIQYKLLNFKEGFKNIFFLLSNILTIRKYCLANKIDIIHTHHRYPELISYIVAKLLKIKTVTTVHSYVKGYALLSFKSDRIIAVSNYIENMLTEKFKVEKSKITLLHNFIEPTNSFNDENINTIRDKLNINLDDFVILFVGRISYIKGIDILIKAFKELNNTYKNLKLLLIGQEFDYLISKFNLKNERNVILIPPQKEIQNYYAISNIVVLPSRIDPFPFVMIEAGLFGKPFIGSRTGGIEEFIEHGKDGLLFQAGNVGDLKDSIKVLINNTQLSKYLSNNLSQKIKSMIDPDHYLNSLNNIYKNI